VGRSVLLLAVTFAVGSIGVGSTAATVQTEGSRASAARLCPVSKTSSHAVPGRSSFNFGNARIAVHLPNAATFIAIPDGSPRGGQAFIQKNGWIRTKLGWFTPHDTPHVTGRRTDGMGRRLRADVGPRSYASGPFYPSLLYFPSLGCWRITATAGSAHLTAIVNVRR
jgi:hypothetical protein